jgi:hypothetical protein
MSGTMDPTVPATDSDPPPRFKDVSPPVKEFAQLVDWLKLFAFSVVIVVCRVELFPSPHAAETWKHCPTRPTKTTR